MLNNRFGNFDDLQDLHAFDEAEDFYDMLAVYFKNEKKDNDLIKQKAIEDNPLDLYFDAD